MFSSLEALDAEDALNAAPVVRQGAFQPKAKPRVRKGGVAPVRKPSSLSSAPASITVQEAGPIHDADLTEAGGNSYVEVARSPIITASECQGKNSPVKVAEISESPTKVAAEAQGAIASLEQNPSTGVNGSSHALSEGDGMGSLTTVLHDAPSAFEELLASHSFKPDQSTQENPSTGVNGSSHALSEGDGIGSLTTVLHDAPSAFEELLASHSFKPDQSTRKKHEPRRRSHSRMDKEGAPLELAREEQLSQQTHPQSDVLEPFTTCIQSLESEIVAPFKYVEHTRAERLDKSNTEVNEEPLVGHGADAKGVLTLSSGPPVQTNTESVKKKKKRGHDQRKTHQENASLNADSNSPKETSKPKKTKFAKFAASVSATASQAEEISDEANGAKETTQEAVVGSAVDPVKKKKKRGGNQAKEGSNDVEKVSSNTVNVTTSKETKKAKRAAIFAATASASASQPGAEVANERNCAVESVQEALLGNSAETVKRKKRTSNEAEEEQDIAENVSLHTVLTSSSRETNKRTRKKPARFADGADEDFIRASTQESSEILEENKRRNSSPANKGKGDAENDFLITFVQEKTNVKKSKLASFSATMSQDVALAENGSGNSAPPANEKGQKKKFRKCLPSRRRVERRAMNPANPDLDPKKMTMKDIIRLAEAKEKLLKNGNPKKAKDGNEVTTNALEKEDESFESTCLAPQVQFVDGRIVINQASLTVSAHPKDDIRTYTRVEETHSKLNYHSYMKRTPKLKWKKDETDLFYEALREFGTNFAMIQHLFPGRTRKQVLLKYKKEEKSCPLRVSEAMRLKPCETSHFMELMSSMNLLPSEIPDTLESEPGFDPLDTTFCREEIENGNCIVAGAERRTVDDASKLEEFSTQSKDGEKHENSGSNPCNSEACTLLKADDNHSQEAPKTAEMTKPSESPIKASSPPRKKKSLFSYQTATIKS